jgi:hypothetical protein
MRAEKLFRSRGEQAGHPAAKTKNREILFAKIWKK